MIASIRFPRAGAIRALAWPASLVVVLLAADANPARAQRPHCGSLAIRPGDAAVWEALGLSVPADLPPEAEAVRDGSPRPAERPCDGPSCSRGSDPRPATPTTSPPPLEHWACLDPGGSPVPAPPRILPARDRRPRPGRVAARVFHPPRAS